ncbi:family 43 glycosylhydrolase [Agarilytica rhodophyticola]|uniref:family 43 glycosylhydrolase n=1 Tax=Agarilytica rhodophyticola TaxID=1737490 RepID=UPI000B342FDC|nr:family 43 glycosylhydrolase [Agarilytica rhodophyticola]
MHFPKLKKTSALFLKSIAVVSVVTSVIVAAVTTHAQPLRNRAELPNMNTWEPLLGKMTPEGTADPSAVVFNHNGEEKVYVYTSTDSKDLCNTDRAIAKRYKGNGHFCMQQYRVFTNSTANLDARNWTTHGGLVWQASVPWARQQTTEGHGGSATMWAPDVVKNGNTYYMLFPTLAKNNHQRIGVATASNPLGPFTARPNPISTANGFDHVFDPSAIKVGNQWYIFYVKTGTEQARDKKTGALRYRDNGQPLYFKSIWMAKIDSNFTSISNPRDLKLDRDSYLEGPDAYYAGNDLWVQYASVSAEKQAKPGGGFYPAGYELKQAVAWNNNRPDHMFDTRPGVQVHSFGTQGTKHGSVIKWKDKYFSFYHDHKSAFGAPWAFRKAMYSQVEVDANKRNQVKPFRPDRKVNVPSIGN